MEGKKSVQYTFVPEEKETLEILSAFESELQQKLQENKGQVERVKYYEKFQMSEIDFQNIFITTEKDAEGNISYHVYCGDSSREILSIGSDGKINVSPELEKFLGEIDIEQVMDENEKERGRLRGISEKMKPEEMEQALEGKKNKEQANTTQESSENEIQEVNEDLEEQGQDLRISNYKKNKDNHLAERMPDVFDKSGEYGIAYTKNGFVIISKVNGHYQINDKIQPAKTTMKSVISINQNGEKIERKVPHALMKTNNPEKEMAVTIGQYGDIDIETVKVLPCQERIARGVRTQGEGANKEESYKVRREFETEGREYEHNLAHQVENVEEAQKESTGTTDADITEEDYIPDTEKTWGELMEETGESLPKLIERYNREMQTSQSSEQAVETIESDYENISHEHKRN